MRLRDADIIVLIRERTAPEPPTHRQTAQAEDDLANGPRRQSSDAGLHGTRHCGGRGGVAHCACGTDLGSSSWPPCDGCRSIHWQLETWRLAAVRAEGWIHAAQLWSCSELHGKTLGIWGYGRIGKVVAAMAVRSACTPSSGVAKRHASPHRKTVTRPRQIAKHFLSKVTRLTLHLRLGRRHITW